MRVAWYKSAFCNKMSKDCFTELRSCGCIFGSKNTFSIETVVRTIRLSSPSILEVGAVFDPKVLPREFTRMG